jgi:hypothetical protein
VAANQNKPGANKPPAAPPPADAPPTDAPPAAAPPAPPPTPPAKPAAEAKSKNVKVDLPRARIVKGTAYGPGKEVEVSPEVKAGIDEQLRLEGKTAKQGRGRRAEA